MKICHWVAFPNSGMFNVAASISAAEKNHLGLDSYCINIQEVTTDALDQWADADVHVAHTHFPDEMRRRVTRPLKLVFPAHGTPEHVFHSAVMAAKDGYGHGDGWMLYQYWLQNADAVVTFWPRHQAIMQTLVDKNTKVHLVPMGVNREFWSKGESKGKWSGSPSVFAAENAHTIKWPLDLFLMWPWVYKEVAGASLHVCYLPTDMHRWFFSLINRNGASYGSHVSSATFPHTELRNVFRSVDYQIGLVRYGDFNKLSLEANAAGVKTISYRGNPYSWFWIDEGDQREQARQLTAILKGEIEPRQDRIAPPDISTTAAEMLKVYESVL